MSNFFDDQPEQPAEPEAAAPPAPRPTHQRATEVNNTKRVFDPSIADFNDTERARRIYAERGQKG